MNRKYVSDDWLIGVLRCDDNGHGVVKKGRRTVQECRVFGGSQLLGRPGASNNKQSSSRQVLPLWRGRSLYTSRSYNNSPVSSVPE